MQVVRQSARISECPAGRGPLRAALGLLALISLVQPAVLPAQTGGGSEPSLSSGRDIYRVACVSCHGADGRGADRSSVGFDTRLPDFTACAFSTKEPDADWGSIVHEGGPARGWSKIMPAFRDALTQDQIDMVIEYLRGFCTSKAWPRGDLNLPRAMVTEKAFPENETVLTTSLNAQGAAGVGEQIVYEKRFGAANQLEVTSPVLFQKKDTGTWLAGFGDVTLGWKRMLLHSMRTGSIFSVAGEVNLPAGDRARGLGSGVTVFESFAAYGQILPADTHIQFQGGIELPTHTDKAPRAAYWRTAFGKSFSQNRGFGRTWTPMVELLADRDLEKGAITNWDVLPQFQVTLSRRQHIMANFGVRVPVNNTVERPIQVMFYLLWDWFDGGLREGW
jgi:mono/diheme cytochrome c family protein